jgi:hypothetical protein
MIFLKLIFRKSKSIVKRKITTHNRCFMGDHNKYRSTELGWYSNILIVSKILNCLYL